MPFLLVPQGVGTNDATVWVGVINEPGATGTLALRCNGVKQSVGEWLTWQSGSSRLDYQRVSLTGLQPRTAYPLDLSSNGAVVADCRLRTLPAQLPVWGREPPFIVLLASCFCSRQDAAGSLGLTYSRLPLPERPEVKILSGDQVYLDDPALHFLTHTHSRVELAAEHFANYVRTWTQSEGGAGFLELLKDGANYFSSDDHEFWNNAPGWASFLPDTWTPQGRADWMSVARELYSAFQTPDSMARFAVGPVSVFIADTRINRDADRTNFMSAQDFTALRQWVQTLDGVGVLVIGQPVFSEPAGLVGNLTDWNLSDYAQYPELVRTLGETRRPLLILTGDVHYGRIAYCPPRPNANIIEVISSPTSLVSRAVGGKWSAAPSLFPTFAIPGVVAQGIETDPDLQLVEDHFLTLAFATDGARVRVTVKAWPVAPKVSWLRPIFGASVNPVFVKDLLL